MSIGTSGLAVSGVPNVSGAWRLNPQVETSDASFQDLKMHYEVRLKQDGDRVTGGGTRISGTAKTPVTMTGTVAGDRLTLNFVELGLRPETRGKIVVFLDDASTLRGRFSTSAIPSAGHIEAHRVTPAQ